MFGKSFYEEVVFASCSIYTASTTTTSDYPLNKSLIFHSLFWAVKNVA